MSSSTSPKPCPGRSHRGISLGPGRSPTGTKNAKPAAATCYAGPMVEDHRRVETRQIVGSGMATDPERIEQVRHDAERRERDTREQPAEAFGDVLGRAPARADLADASGTRPRPGPPAAASAALPAGGASSGPTPDSPQPPRRPPERTTPRAPDPRAKLLHAQLSQRSPSRPAPPVATTGDDATPPTLPAQRTPRS